MRWIMILLALIFLISCTDPTSSSSGPKISMDDVSISHTNDADGDGYFSEARLNFDVDYSSGSIDVVIVIAYQGIGDTEHVYFVSTKTEIDGTDEQTYYVVLNDGFGHDSYDFTIYVYDADDLDNDKWTELYKATKSNHSALGGVKLEKYNEDTLPYDITFNNHTYTTIDMTVTGLASYDIPAGGNHTFHYANNPGSIDIYGTTSGKTTSGTQIGLLISFSDYGYSTSGSSSNTISLNITSTYYFQRMQNTSIYHIAGPVYVNYGTADQTIDYIQIPNDGVNYNTGYYKALPANVVRAYVNTTDYAFWTLLSYPGVSNQVMNLTFSYQGKMKTGPAISFSTNNEVLIPSLNLTRSEQGNADFQIFGVPIDLLQEKQVDPRMLRSHPNIDKLRELFNSK